MRAFLQGTILLCLLSLCLSYEQINSNDQLMNYHQMNSQFPIIHLYHNRHFSASRQFQDFLQVLEETEYRNRDYVRFVLTDCERFKEGATYACDEMRRTKDNRMVFGYYPSEQFVNYGGKRMQNPPKNRQFNHPSDVYTVQELETFIGQIMPNFFGEISSVQQYEQWLQPRYAPKILFASREDEVPLVLKKLGVNYFLRFDMGFVSDLSENVVEKVQISSFPALMVLKYNFEKKVLDAFPYEGTEFTEQNYQKIKDFLQPHALAKPRNDVLFHMMKLQPDAGILVSDNSAQLQQMLDRASGWVIVSVVQGEPQKLKQLRNRYGRFFTYLHFLGGNETETLELYDSQHKTMHEMPNGEIYFKALNKDEFIQTLAVWLKKNFVLMGVRQKYSHYCALSLNHFFRGLTHCLIVKEDQYEAVSKAMNMEFQQGFACYETNAKTDQKIVGRALKGSYEEIYLNVEYLTRVKSKEIVDDFVERPIKPIQGRDKLAQICAFPTKKCAILFMNSNKADRTAYDYLKDIAINFINQYQFYEIDLKCNPHFAEEIQVLRKNNGGLLVYHPKNKSYVALKAKLSKSTFEKFLRANLKDNKKLPFHQFNDQNVYVTVCPKDTEKESESTQRESL